MGKKVHIPDHQWSKQKRKQRLKNKKRDKKRTQYKSGKSDNWWRKHYHLEDDDYYEDKNE